MSSREFDVLLLGATGITGRVALEYLTRRSAELGRSFAVGARDPQKVRDLCDRLGIAPPPIVRTDATDARSVAAFVSRGAVLVNLAGPYSDNGDTVVSACIDSGTSYADLTAETQFIRRTDARHDDAIAAGVAVVQTSGLEALPADLLVDIAREQLRERGELLIAADLQLSVRQSPGAGFADSISGGTAQSILRVFSDRADPALDDIAFRVGDPVARVSTRSASPLRLWPRITAGAVVAPMIPVAFINPPVIHRSTWLRAQEAGEPFTPLRYRDGARFGPWGGIRGWLALAAAEVQSAVQAFVVAIGRMPHPVRRGVVATLGRMLPSSGAGPSGPSLEEWRWEIVLRGVSDRRSTVTVRLEADGHPGYATTARMIAELALILADGTGTGRTGCLTPALAVGAISAPRFAEAGMRFS